VQAGAFWMGCNEAVDDDCSDFENPYHQVTLDGFFIDTYEVTAGQYKACVDAGACSYNGPSSADSLWGHYRTYNNGRDEHPINYVSWAEAQAYCAWLEKTLPTEAQWEKASRGTEGLKYPWGNSPEASCTHAVMYGDGVPGCGENGTWAVGSKPLGVSPYGAHDMIGNVWEWTADWYSSGYYSQTPDDGWVNPLGPDSGESRVLRGGSWDYLITGDFRSSNRRSTTPSDRVSNLGFRCSESP